jgi:hypothetical protein
MGKTAFKMLLKSGFQTGYRDERVLRSLVADDATDFFFYRWKDAHEPIITYCSCSINCRRIRSLEKLNDQTYVIMRA